MYRVVISISGWREHGLCIYVYSPNRDFRITVATSLLLLPEFYPLQRQSHVTRAAIMASAPPVCCRKSTVGVTESM